MDFVSRILVIISIHAPREGSDASRRTYPVDVSDFNPRSPRGERRDIDWTAYNRERISIHAPREGSDLVQGQPITVSSISIHAPREGSDMALDHQKHILPISIHAPREGSDL